MSPPAIAREPGYAAVWDLLKDVPLKGPDNRDEQWVPVWTVWAAVHAYQAATERAPLGDDSTAGMSGPDRNERKALVTLANMGRTPTSIFIQLRLKSTVYRCWRAGWVLRDCDAIDEHWEITRAGLDALDAASSGKGEG